MEALEALLTRRSVRAYEERMPTQDLIAVCIFFPLAA